MFSSLSFFKLFFSFYKTNKTGKLYNLIAQSASNMVVAYNYMNYKLVAAGRTYNPGYYLIRSNALVAGNQNVLNDVSKIIQSSSG